MRSAEGASLRGITLYTSLQIESSARRTQLSLDVLTVLVNGYGFRIWGNFPSGKTVYVQTGFDGGYALWSVSDNGGEFNVEEVNYPATMRSMPYVDRWGVVDAGTVAYRLAMVIKGHEIDWDARWPDLVEDFARDEAVSS